MNSKSSICRLPILVIACITFPTLVTLYFYITYSHVAWFFQDDFMFIAKYANSMQFNQILSSENFGRFLSRNAYWHFAIEYFSYNSKLFFVLNFFIILCTCSLLYMTFEKFGKLNGFFAGLFYFILPSTIESYVWLSNSQHILVHFFVILFVYLFTSDFDKKSRARELIRMSQLFVVLMLGFSSNILMSMVTSLPIFMILANKEFRRSKIAYLTAGFGLLLFSLYFFKLSEQNAGAYSTWYTLETAVTNLNFYFGNILFAAIWIISILFGAIYALVKKSYLASWLLIASVIFLLPFAFLVHQRYVQYGALTYLFFVLGIWLLLIESKLTFLRNLNRYVGVLILWLLFSNTLEPSIRFYSESPRGTEQRHQVNFLRNFATQNTNVRNYCFRPTTVTINQTGVEAWDIPREWWFLGFGHAFTHFVDNRNTYSLFENGKNCDVIFEFKRGNLELVTP